MSRQIVLDTETTGLEPEQGHRVIEIGCVELVDRRRTGNDLHQFLNPDREIDQGAVEVHGITTDDLRDKPRFPESADAFLDYIRGAEVIIHNAPFDVGFLDHELMLAGRSERVSALAEVTDTLLMARKMHPGQRNSLDALCRRYEIDNSHRQLHGALLDAEILADVYLRMTGGQSDLGLFTEDPESAVDAASVQVGHVSGAGDYSALSAQLILRKASETELSAHEARMQAIEKESGRRLWS